MVKSTHLALLFAALARRDWQRAYSHAHSLHVAGWPEGAHWMRVARLHLETDTQTKTRYNTRTAQ
jgi:hypothetical protein